MDITQIVTLSVILVLTVFLVILGFQLFFVLKDFRKTLFKVNRLFDNADDLILQVKKPIEQAGSVVTAMTAGVGIAQLLKKIGEKDSKK